MHSFLEILPSKIASLKGRTLLILSDYDGTLVPIKLAPEEALIEEDLRQLLRKLAHKQGVAVGIVSGRQLSKLKTLVALPELWCVGNHGLEIEGPKGSNISFVHEEAIKARPFLSELFQILSKSLEDFPGVLLEDKYLGLSIHYRRVKVSQIPEFKRRLQDVLSPRVEKMPIDLRWGKMVFEVRPRVCWNKGTAALWILERLGNTFLPLYFGDNSTDEDAFTALEKRGLTVRVRKSAMSHARYYVKSPKDVKIVLETLRSQV